MTLRDGFRLLGLMGCIAFGARAEETSGPAPVDLPPVVVPVPEAPPEPSSPVDPSAARTVIRPSEQAGQAKDTAEMLAAAPGVSIQDSGGFGQAKSLSIRGAS